MPAPAPAGPKLLASGEAAARIVARILPTSRPIRVNSGAMGEVELRPGTVFSGERMLVYASPMTVYYTNRGDLYEWNTSYFLQDEWFNALSRGAATAMPMVHLAEIEITFLTAFFVPWQIVLGMFVAKTAFFYSRHKPLVDKAVRESPHVMRLIIKFEQRCPTLFKKLSLTAGKEILFNFPKGVTAEDVAYFLGRVIGTQGILKLGDIALVPVLKVVAEYAVLVSLLHLPSITAHWLAQDIHKNVAMLKSGLAKSGIYINDEEARKMLHELRMHPDTEKVLRDLETASKALLPVLNELQKAIRTST